MSSALPAPASASSLLLAQCYKWYQEHLDDGDVGIQWRWMHQLLFQKTRSIGAKDLWKPGAGVPQPGVALVVSKEYVAMQIMKVIQTEES